MPSVVKPVYKSLVRHVNDQIDELNNLGNFPTLQYHDFESRGDEDKLPRTTLVGLDGFSFDKNKGLWIIRVALAISSYRDANLLHEMDLIDELEQRMGEEQTIPLREMINGDEVSELYVQKFQIYPMAQSELRNYRTIAMELSRTGV
ncbi:MAG: hypothetical protein ACTHJR_16495 [Sphingomonas sp.]|uniref:hypothetical protein n=1 Tax=Sphingomonas sp. TaxID=28214 RepID=UPI003F81D4A1